MKIPKVGVANTIGRMADGATGVMAAPVSLQEVLGIFVSIFAVVFFLTGIAAMFDPNYWPGVVFVVIVFGLLVLVAIQFAYQRHLLGRVAALEETVTRLSASAPKKRRRLRDVERLLVSSKTVH